MASDLTIPESHDTAAWVAALKLIDTDEPVIGGIDGISNAQAIQLAKRTTWLRAVITAVVDAAEVDPNPANLDQLLEAITAIVAAGVGSDVLRRATNTPNLAAGFYVSPKALAIAGGVVTPVFLDRNVFTLAVTEAFTLANPATIPAGGGARIIATQDATGRALTLGSAYRIIGGEWSAEPNAVNILEFVFGGGAGLIDVDITQRGAA